MSIVRSLLLSPCLSPYDDVENGVLSSYIFKAITNNYSNSTPIVYNLLLDTPWILYREHALYVENPANKIEPDDNLKYSIFTFAILSIVLYLSSISDFVCVNANGPVMNEGFATMIGFLAAVNKPVLYWKDDVRRLYGARDNPLVIGFLSSVSQRIVNPIDRLSYIDPNSPTTCGPLYLDNALKNLLLNSSPANINVSPKFQFLISMGKDLYDNTYAFARGTDSSKNPFQMNPVQVYNNIKTIFLKYAKSPNFLNYFPQDYNYFLNKQ